MRERKQYHDPITGDELKRLEYFTRQIQVFVRTPWFILVFNVVTLVAMLFGHGDTWNYFASWLAIIIEWLVGTYMFGQTGRDAVILRKLNHIVQHTSDIAEKEASEIGEAEDHLLIEDQRMLAIMEHLDRQDAMIYQIVRKIAQDDDLILTIITRPTRMMDTEPTKDTNGS